MTHGREIERNDDAGGKTILRGKFPELSTLLFLIFLLIFTHQNANGQSLIDKHLIEGVYYLIVEDDLNQAEAEFQAILAIDKNHAEAYYFLGRIYYERVLSSSEPKSMLREAKKYLSMAHSLGIVYDKLHPNLLRYNGNHRPSNKDALLTILEGFSPEIVSEVTQSQGTGAFSSAATFGATPERTPFGRGELTLHNDSQSRKGNADELRYLSQPKAAVLPAPSGKAVATLFLETGGSGISDVQILSADALGFTRKRVYEPGAPIELVSGARYRVEFGSKKRGVQILTPLAIMGVGLTLLLMR